MSLDLPAPSPRRYVPYLEGVFVFLSLAAILVAWMADFGPAGNQITEYIGGTLPCLTVGVCLRRDWCEWISARVSPAAATIVLAPAALALVAIVAYTVLTHPPGRSAPPTLVLVTIAGEFHHRG